MIVLQKQSNKLEIKTKFKQIKSNLFKFKMIQFKVASFISSINQIQLVQLPIKTWAKHLKVTSAATKSWLRMTKIKRISTLTSIKNLNFKDITKLYSKITKMSMMSLYFRRETINSMTLIHIKRSMILRRRMRRNQWINQHLMHGAIKK